MSAILYPDPDEAQISDEDSEEVNTDLSIPEKGCRFQSRCPYADEKCRAEMPELHDYGNGHFCACHHCEKQ